jgi:hypothetical protein
VNRIDPTGMSSIMSGYENFGGSFDDFQQPPWDRAAGIELGYDPYQQLTQGPSRGADQIQLRSAPAPSTLGQSGLGAESLGIAATSTADLGPGYGLIPNSFNCEGEFCPESTQNSALYVGGAVGGAAVVAAAPKVWAATEVGRNQVMLVAAAAQQVGPRTALQLAKRAALASKNALMVAGGHTLAFLTSPRGGPIKGFAAGATNSFLFGEAAPELPSVNRGFDRGVAVGQPFGEFVRAVSRGMTGGSFPP